MWKRHAIHQSHAIPLHYFTIIIIIFDVVVTQICFTSQTLLLWTHHQRRRELMKCVIQGKANGKQRRGRPKTSYSSNITKWTSESMERNTRETQDRAGWRRLVRCAARAADHHSWWDRARIRSYIRWSDILNTQHDELISVSILRLSQHNQGFCAARLHTSTVGNVNIAHSERSYYCYIPHADVSYSLAVTQLEFGWQIVSAWKQKILRLYKITIAIPCHCKRAWKTSRNERA